jgi:hypothetical protein
MNRAQAELEGCEGCQMATGSVRRVGVCAAWHGLNCVLLARKRSSERIAIAFMRSTATACLSEMPYKVLWPDAHHIEALLGRRRSLRELRVDQAVDSVHPGVGFELL